MKMRLAAALVVGLFLGLAVSLFLGRPQAQAQRQDQSQHQKWEYNVQFFGVMRNEADMNQVSKRFSTRFNQLAKDGWDYVGLTGVPGGPGAFLLFRRHADGGR